MDFKQKVNNDNNNIISRDEEVVIPNWSPFNEIISMNKQPVSTVGYCSVIPHPPTSYDAVYTAMKNFVALCESCGKVYSVLTADMAIYLMSKVIQMQSITNILNFDIIQIYIYLFIHLTHNTT